MANQFKLPDLGEGIHEAEILNVRVVPGDSIREGDILLELETDKATVEMPSPFSGVVVEVRVKPGDVVNVGDVLLSFSQDGKKETVLEEGDASVPKVSSGIVPASPSTRRLARELQVELAKVTATGPGGRVTAENVRSYAQTRAAGPQIATIAGTPPPVPVPVRSTEPQFESTDFGPVERVALRSIRKATARHMAKAWAEIPHVTSQDEVDITDLEAFRERHKHKAAEQGGGLTLTVLALKALASAIKRYPGFNATLDAESGTLIYKKYVHVGVAVDTPEGLVVPVVRSVDQKSILELAVEVKLLTQRARERKISLEELQGGSITLTNIGHLGGTHFTPIINHPQVAILGMGAARYKPVVKKNASGELAIVPRLMLPLIVAMDHRVIDGADGMRFLNDIMALLGDPEQMLLKLS